MPSAVILWQKFGPYHMARLAAAISSLKAQNFRVTGLEIASRQRDYIFGDRTDAAGATVEILFEGRDYADLTPSALALATYRKLHRMKPDVVAICGYREPESLAALAWAKANRAVAILMSENNAYDRQRHLMSERIKSHVVKKYGAAIVAGTNACEYLRQLGYPLARIRLGYAVVDNGHFRTGSDEARREAVDTRSRLGLPDSYLLAVARFMPRKNLDGLIGAYGVYARGTNSPLPLLIFGDGSERQALEAVAAASPGRVEVRQPIGYDDLPAVYGLATALVMPSLSEQWGLVINEGMAAGLPILASTAAGATRDLVESGRNGWTFDPRSRDDMAQAITRVAAADQAALSGMSRESRNIIAKWDSTRFGQSLAEAVQIAFSAERKAPSPGL